MSSVRIVLREMGRTRSKSFVIDVGVIARGDKGNKGSIVYIRRKRVVVPMSSLVLLAIQDQRSVLIRMVQNDRTFIIIQGNRLLDNLGLGDIQLVVLFGESSADSLMGVDDLKRKIGNTHFGPLHKDNSNIFSRTLSFARTFQNKALRIANPLPLRMSLEILEGRFIMITIAFTRRRR